MSRVDPLNRQTSPSALALSQQQQQQQISQSTTSNVNTPQTGAVGTLVQGPQQQDPYAAAKPTQKQIENRLDNQLAAQLPTTPAPSATQKDPTAQATNSSPAPNGGLDSSAGSTNYSPDKALASNLAKDLNNTQETPQLPEPADPQTSGAQSGLDPRLQAEINLARGRAHDQKLNQTDEPTSTHQDLGDNNLAQLLTKPPETTPEAPVATTPEASAFDNQHPRGDPRNTQTGAQGQTGSAGSAGATLGKDGQTGLDPQHPSALLLADSKLGAARLAALLTPAALQQQDDGAAPMHGKKAAATVMMSNLGAEAAEEAHGAEAASPHSGLPSEAPGGQAQLLARANTAADAAARLGAERAAMLLQALSAAGQPLVAVVWTDIFRMQQARLDQLTANRGVDEDGEMAPTDSEEAIRRQRRIQSVDLSGTSGRGTVPGWDEQEEEDPLAGVDVWFRAALLATALQRPQIVTRMFRAAAKDETQKIRFFRRDKAARFLEQWHALSAGQVPISALPDLPREAAPVLAMAGRNAPEQGLKAREQLHTWMEAAEQAYATLLKDTNVLAPGRGARRGEQALEMIHGRDAVSVPVSLAAHEAASMWGQIIRTNPPYDEPVVATTTATAIDGLLPDHAYAVLGTFRRGPEWMVALCNPAGTDGYSDACGIFGLPFHTLLRNASELTMLRKVRG